jgi:hypothetical protein
LDDSGSDENTGKAKTFGSNVCRNSPVAIVRPRRARFTACALLIACSPLRRSRNDLESGLDHEQPAIPIESSEAFEDQARPGGRPQLSYGRLNRPFGAEGRFAVADRRPDDTRPRVDAKTGHDSRNATGAICLDSIEPQAVVSFRSPETHFLEPSVFFVRPDSDPADPRKKGLDGVLLHRA